MERTSRFTVTLLKFVSNIKHMYQVGAIFVIFYIYTFLTVLNRNFAYAAALYNDTKKKQQPSNPNNGK